MGWSQWPGLNRRPTVYETVALPLSYIGVPEAQLKPDGRSPLQSTIILSALNEDARKCELTNVYGPQGIAR